MQSLFYLSLGFLLLLTLGGRLSDSGVHSPSLTCARFSGPTAPKLSLFYLFDYEAISAHSFSGWHAGRLRRRLTPLTPPLGV